MQRNKKKVLLLVFNDFTKDTRVLKEARSLTKKYNVTVYAFYRKGLQEKETLDGFYIERMKGHYCYRNSSYFIKLIMAIKCIFIMFVKGKGFDYVHCNDIETLPLGFLIKILNFGKCKIIYDAHEYEIEKAFISFYTKIIYKILEKVLLPFVHNVITVSYSIGEEYKKLYNLNRVRIVLNTPLNSEIQKSNKFREIFKIPDNKKIFVYQGGITHGRNISFILDAFKRLKNEIHIVFMGYGPLEDLVIEQEKEYDNIHFLKAVPPDKILIYTSSADYGIHIPEAICKSYTLSLPNKIFEYLMAEIPIVVSNFQEMGEFVKKTKVGITCEPDSIDSVVNAIKKIAQSNEEQYRNNIMNVKNSYNWEEQEKELLAAYE